MDIRNEQNESGRPLYVDPAGALKIAVDAGQIGAKVDAASALPVGGAGLIGWLSRLWYEISVRLPATLGIKTAAESLSITPATDAEFASVPTVNASAAASYRSAVTAADVIAAPGTVTCTKQAGGSATAGTYTVFVVAVNAYGRTTATQGNATVTTETTNLTVRAAFAAVTGATHYDIYCSTDGAAAKFVGRITEAQRASGIKLTAVNTTGAGGTAGAVDIEVPGTGLAVNGGQLTQNTAFSIPASPVDCSGRQYVDFDLTFSRTGDIVAPALKVIPFFLNDRTSTYQAGEVQTVYFGGGSGAYEANKQRLRIEARGNSGVALALASIAGTGASLDIDVVLS